MVLLDVISIAQAGDKFATQLIVDRFSNLLKKYARKLRYEDAYEDLLLELLEALAVLPVRKMQGKSDGAAVNYLSKCIHNAFIALSKKSQERRSHEVCWSSLSDMQQNFIESKMATSPVADNLSWQLDGLSLTVCQKEVLLLLYTECLPVSSIAQQRGVSRQSINRTKNQGLKKLAQFAQCEAAVGDT